MTIMNKYFNYSQWLLDSRKKNIQEALDNYDPETGIGGYTILRAARDGLLVVKND